MEYKTEKFYYFQHSYHLEINSICIPTIPLYKVQVQEWEVQRVAKSNLNHEEPLGRGERGKSTVASLIPPIKKTTSERLGRLRAALPNSKQVQQSAAVHMEVAAIRNVLTFNHTEKLKRLNIYIK